MTIFAQTYQESTCDILTAVCTALIGRGVAPSKSTLLRVFNALNDTIAMAA